MNAHILIHIKQEREMITTFFQCYYCSYQTKDEEDYQSHVILSHNKGMCYPNVGSIRKNNLKRQYKAWEA